MASSSLAQAAGEKRLDSQKAFGAALDSRGIEPGKVTGGLRVRHGIELTDEARAVEGYMGYMYMGYIKGWG
jgi:hypothetical protein